MEQYVINPFKEFPIFPRLSLSACNMTEDVIAKIKRLRVDCVLLQKDPNTTIFNSIQNLTSCSIASGVMKYGSEYRIAITAFDLYNEYKSVTKSSQISLVKP